MDVSILVLVHKDSEYIDYAIKSALNQKFSGSFEVILCSDNNINLKKYSDKFNIKFVMSDKKNNLTTCSYSVNKGVEIADGKYIKILAYDDWLPENSIQILYDEIIRTGSSVVCANSNDVRGDKITTVKSANINYTLDDLLVKNVIHGGTVLFNKSDFNLVGGYNTNLKFAEEYDFHLKILHNNKKITYIDKLVHFYRRHNNQKGSSSLTEQQKKEKIEYVDTEIRNKYINNRVVCGIATIKDRCGNLKLAVESIINQVDKLIVYQNGYKEIFDFLVNKKIQVISSLDTGIDMGDAGKFFEIKNIKNSYYLTIDDDLIYPPNYVENIVNNLKNFKNKVIVSHHGRLMKNNPKSYYLDISESYRCLDDISKITQVHFGGTGVMGLHTTFINTLSFNYFKSPNMADIWIGKYAEENKIPIMVLPHKKGWINYSLDLKSNDTIHKKYQHNHEVQNQVIKQMYFNLKNTNKKKIVFLICTYKRQEITKIFVNELTRVQNSLKNLFDFTNIVIDSDNTNLSIFKENKNFQYYNYNNNPLSNKWNYGASFCKNLIFDYVFILGSDDIVSEDLLRKYYEYINLGYDYIGFKDLYFYEIKEKNLYYWTGYESNSGRFNEPIGLGRCLSNNLISSLDFKLWENNLNRGLDLSMQLKINNIKNINKTVFSLGDKFFACDIKSETNITKLKTYNPNSLKKINTNEKFYKKIKDIVDLKNNKSISIIIPTYNNTQYIGECLNSIIDSGKNQNIEILVGVDGCEESLKHIKSKSYPDFVKFYYFKENVGPYIIKNSLTKISNSENLLFFDSDDIITRDTIEEVVTGLKNHNVVRLKCENYTNGKPTNKTGFGEGVFAINKNLFLSMNGFEPWKVAADSDFMGRLYKNKPRIYHTKNIAFYYRQHQTSLTKRPDTGMSSQLRASYFKLSKTKNGNPEKLHTIDFDYVNVSSYKIPNNFKYDNLVRKEKINKVLNPTPRKVVDNKILKTNPVVVDRLSVLYGNKPESVRTIKTNTPDNRQEIINKKNNIKNTLNELFPKKTNPKEGKNMINFGGKLNR